MDLFGSVSDMCVSELEDAIVDGGGDVSKRNDRGETVLVAMLCAYSGDEEVRILLNT